MYYIKQKKDETNRPKFQLHLFTQRGDYMILSNKEKIKLFEYKKFNKILDKDNKIEILIKLMEEYEYDCNYEYIECPNCKSDQLIRYGYYERNIGIFGVYKKIKIKRVMCKHCNHTHALLPSFIMSYFQNEVSFILVGIDLKNIEEEKIVDISNKLNISRQLLYFWLKRFQNHLTRLKTTFSYNLEKIMIYLFDGIKTRKKYIEINGVYFLQKVPT